MEPIRLRASIAQQPTVDVEDVPDSYYDTRLPTSTRRYVDTQGNQVIQQGNRRFVIHDEPPPRRKIHWVAILGTGMILMLLLWLGLTWLGNWWSMHLLELSRYRD